MYTFAQVDEARIEQTLVESKNFFERLSETYFNAESLLTLVAALIAALILGRIIAFMLRKVTKLIGIRADKTDNLDTLTRLRRLETLIVLSIAIIRALLVVFAIYFWWSVGHPEQQSSAILGAGAVLAIILTGALGPLLRDLANGSAMMAEHWYGVGDHISIDPLVDGQGIVERVTLRSTKVRGVNGEVIWVNNQNIWAVRVTPKGVRTIAIELFATDAEKIERLIEDTNLRLPIGPLVVVSPISIMTSAKIRPELWHITALAEVAPGRDWLIDKFALKIMQELDAKENVLVHEPISRFSDSEAERRFARTINNARKLRLHRESVVSKVTRKHNAAKKISRQHKQAVADKAAAQAQSSAKRSAPPPAH